MNILAHGHTHTHTHTHIHTHTHTHTHTQAIRAAGATSVSIFITHGVFPAESWKKFINGEVTFENIWITDSIPHCLEIAKQRPFKLLTLSQMIADSLLGYDLVSESQ